MFFNEHNNDMLITMVNGDNFYFNTEHINKMLPDNFCDYSFIFILTCIGI